jgi:hypothetical protein
MSRIRSVHPGLFTDESFASVSMAARMLIIGIWTEAWDDGVFEWKPLTLKMRIFPADSLTVEPLLSELAESGVICAFERDGKRLGAIRNFCKFQRPKKPNSSGSLPDDIKKYVALEARSSEPVPNQYGTSSEIEVQMEDGGCIGSSTSSLRSDVAASPTAASPKPKRTKPRSQISEDAQPTASDTSAAEAAGLTSAAFREQWSKFRNYHRAKGSLMADWQAAWRTWLGNIAEFQRQPRAGPPSYQNGKTGGFTLLKQAILENERAKSTQNNGPNPAVQLLPVNGTAKPGTSVGYDDGLPDSSERLFGN